LNITFLERETLMYEDVQFCNFCGRKLVRRLTKEVSYSYKTGKPDGWRWTLFCPATRGLPDLFLDASRHEHKKWWVDAR